MVGWIILWKGLSSLNISFFFVQGIPAPPSLSEALEQKAESARMVERQVCSLCCPYVDEKVPVCEYKNPNKIMFGDYGKLDATHSKWYWWTASIKFTEVVYKRQWNVLNKSGHVRDAVMNKCRTCSPNCIPGEYEASFWFSQTELLKLVYCNYSNIFLLLFFFFRL